MAKENKILAVDIGSNSLKMAEFVFPNGGGIQLNGFLFRKVEKLDGESDSECFERNYLDMLEEGGFTASSVRLLLSGSNSFQRLCKLPPVAGNSGAVSRLIEYEAAQAVPYSIDEVEWGYQLLHHTWEEMRPVENEDGSTESIPVVNEEFEALFVAMKSDDVVCYTDAIERSGKVIASVELAPLALFNAAVVSQIREDESVLILDIGTRSSSLMIADHRRIFMRNIPIGGDSVTMQIAREFGVSEVEAEEFKRRHGFVALGGAYDEPDSELTATISKISRNVMTRLHGEISRSISVWRAQHGGNAPVRVLLAGGGSTMQYTTDFFQEKLRLPVEYLNTFGLINIAPEVDRNALQMVASMSQTLIGASLRNIGTLPVDIMLIPRSIRRQFELNARKPYFYASAVALVCCLLISLIGMGKSLENEKVRSEKYQRDLKSAQQEVNKINRLLSQRNNEIGRYEEVQRLLAGRNKYTAMLSELQQMLPDRMWLVKLEPTVNAENSDESIEGGNTRQIKEHTVNSINRLRQVSKITLAGYVLGDSTEVDRFDENFKKRNLETTCFESMHINRNEVSDRVNLTYFEVELTLKEAIDK